MNMRRSYLLLFLATIGLAQGCTAHKRSTQQGECGALLVVVRDYEERAVPNAIVTIMSGDGSSMVTKKTDNSGILQETVLLASAPLTIKVTKAGYNEMRRFSVTLRAKETTIANFHIERLSTIREQRKETIK